MLVLKNENGGDMTYLGVEMVADLVEPPAPGMEGSAGERGK